MLELSEPMPAMVVGNGPNEGVAEEAALRPSATITSPALQHEGQESAHGPEMQIVPGYLVFIVDAPQGSERLANIADALSNVTAKTVLLTAHPKGRAHEVAVPQVAPLLSPDKGTFRIGIRLSDYVEGHSVRVRWFAYKPTRDTAQFRSRDNVVIKITPDIQKLRPLERVRFTAEVDGTEVKSVTWAVSDPEGGSIDDNGLYQAPSEEGTYAVIARSNADGEARTSAVVLVGE